PKCEIFQIKKRKNYNLLTQEIIMDNFKDSINQFFSVNNNLDKKVNFNTTNSSNKKVPSDQNENETTTNRNNNLYRPPSYIKPKRINKELKEKVYEVKDEMSKKQQNTNNKKKEPIVYIC